MADAAVRPGMEGGQYKPLTDHEMQRIHETAIKLLETVGLAQAIPTCVDAMTAKGCWINEHGRLCIPRALVEDTLASCARNFVLHARDPKHDMQPSGNKVYFGTAGAAVHIVEPETRSYRESLLVDLYDAGRIVDNCEHIHFYQRPVTARDMITGHDLDINTMYACLAGTEKHVGTSMVEPGHVSSSRVGSAAPRPTAVGYRAVVSTSATSGSSMTSGWSRCTHCTCQRSVTSASRAPSPRSSTSVPRRASMASMSSRRVRRAMV